MIPVPSVDNRVSLEALAVEAVHAKVLRRKISLLVENNPEKKREIAFLTVHANCHLRLASLFRTCIAHRVHPVLARCVAGAAFHQHHGAPRLLFVTRSGLIAPDARWAAIPFEAARLLTRHLHRLQACLCPHISCGSYAAAPPPFPRTNDSL